MEMKTICLVVCSMLSLLLTGTSAWQFNKAPQHRVIKPQETVDINCDSDGGVKLTNCQFRILLYKDNTLWKDSGTFDLSDVTPSRLFTMSDDPYEPILTLKYNGSGLDRGHCGVEVGNVTVQGRYVIGCRARDREGEWNVHHMSLHVHDGTALNVTITPAERTVQINSRLQVGCQVPANPPLRSCTFGEAGVLKSTSVNLSDGSRCDVTININEQYNGLLFCDLKTASSEGFGAMSLVVERKPSKPAMTTARLTEHKGVVGDFLHASCTVEASRPKAHITWKFRNGDVASDLVDEKPDPEAAWKWSWEITTVIKYVTIELNSTDYGKIIICSVMHQTLTTPLMAEKMVYKEVRKSTPASTATKTTSTAVMTTKNTPTDPPSTDPHSVDGTTKPCISTTEPTTWTEHTWVIASASAVFLILILVVTLIVVARCTGKCCFSTTDTESKKSFAADDGGYSLPNYQPNLPGPSARATETTGKCDSSFGESEYAEVNENPLAFPRDEQGQKTSVPRDFMTGYEEVSLPGEGLYETVTAQEAVRTAADKTIRYKDPDEASRKKQDTPLQEGVIYAQVSALTKKKRG